MKTKLQNFLNSKFAPYGDFPARADVEQELLANLLEKFDDLKAQGKTDDEAYKIVTDSFGDVGELMQEVPHDETKKSAVKDKPAKSLHRMIVDGIESAMGSTAVTAAVDLRQADLAGIDLVGRDFSASALMNASFDGANLTGAKFNAAALKAASFVGANLTDAVFVSSDLQEVCFDGANLTNAIITTADIRGATFTDAQLVNTEFEHSDLSGVTFAGVTLQGVTFNGSSLKRVVFSNTVLQNVSFRHAAVRHAIFDGATMDKLTYALLKGAKAKLSNITIV